MKTQPDDEGRREMAHALISVMMGAIAFDDIRAELRTVHLDARRLTLPTGAERFVIFHTSNGKVHDSFTFYGEESLDQLCA
jgi:hypothetical protein